MKTEQATGCWFVLTRVYALPRFRARRASLASLKAMIGQPLEVASVWWQNGQIANIALRSPCGAGVTTIFPGDVAGWMMLPCGCELPFPEPGPADPAEAAANTRDTEAWDK